MEDPRGSATRSLQTDLDSTLESVDEAENLVLKAAEESGFNEEDLHKIGMAVREAMVNAVVHGNRYNLKKKVKLEVQVDDAALEIVITDQGEGFEATELPDPLAEENLLRQSGRGLLLIKAFVDRFEMKRVDAGTEVRLVVNRKRSANEQGG